MFHLYNKGDTIFLVKVWKSIAHSVFKIYTYRELATQNDMHFALPVPPGQGDTSRAGRGLRVSTEDEHSPTTTGLGQNPSRRPGDAAGVVTATRGAVQGDESGEREGSG